MGFPLRACIFSVACGTVMGGGRSRLRQGNYGAPEWRNGRRTGLKILGRNRRAGSSPASGTIQLFPAFLLRKRGGRCQCI